MQLTKETINTDKLVENKTHKIKINDKTVIIFEYIDHDNVYGNYNDDYEIEPMSAEKLTPDELEYIGENIQEILNLTETETLND